MTNCPFCKSEEVGINKRPNKYLCRACGKYFTVHSISLAQDPEENSLEPISKLEVTLDAVGKDRIYLVPIGDIHVGAPEGQCAWGKVMRELEYILNTPNCYMLGMGDYMDCAAKLVRKGPNIFSSSMSPMEQYDTIFKAFKPLAEKGKIIGLLTGNHEQWVYEDTGFNAIALLCRELKVPFLGSACDVTLTVGIIPYIGYVQHGSSSAKLSSTKMGSLMNATRDIFADFFLYGHVHQVSVTKCAKLYSGKEIKNYYVLTGHFLNWKGGYAQAFGISPSPTGVAKLSLFSDRHDIHVSL